MEIFSPLGPDQLFMTGFQGPEGISQLYTFRLQAVALNETDIPFDQLIGQRMAISLLLPDQRKRYFSGIVSAAAQGRRDQLFTLYEFDIVPQLWLLTRKARSHIYQHITVPDILKDLFQGLDVEYRITGTWEPRDFCVQYRESNFNFASRLMEEEGIFYFFRHGENGSTMVVSNTPSSHPDVPEPTKAIYDELEGGRRSEDRIFGWTKRQEMRSGRYTLRDHCFQVAHKYLEASDTIQESVQVGRINHRLKVGGNDQLELYDYPGEYAGRFDDVGRGGADTAKNLESLFTDNQRTTEIRMQQEAAPSVVVRGASNCRQFVSGHKFTLERHFSGDGPYLLTTLEHSATHPSSEWRSGGSGQGFTYSNTFTAIPVGVPFRPPRVTPKPFVQGTQTALVVGPTTDEIFTDKYARVKVQFHWDRRGKHDGDSSCWIRVSQAWAGKQWGLLNIPRVGQEVIVDFLEGDPDNPIVIGNVFNADQMSAYGLPDNKTRSWIKTSSTPGGDGHNEIRFEDLAGVEQMFMHAERNMDTRVENDSMENVGMDKHMIVGGGHSRGKGGGGAPSNGSGGPPAAGGGAPPSAPASGASPQGGGGTPPPGGGGGEGGGGNLLEKILNDKFLQVLNDQIGKIFGNQEHMVQGNQDAVTGGNKAERVKGNDDQLVNGNRTMKVEGDQDETVKGTRKILVETDDHLHVKGERKEKIDQDHHRTTGGELRDTVEKDAYLHVKKNRVEKTDDSLYVLVGKEAVNQVAKNYTLATGDEIFLNSMKIVLEAAQELTIKAPGGFVKIDQSGVIIKGSEVRINSGGDAGSGTQPAIMDALDAQEPEDAEPPQVAKEANPKDPTPADNSDPGTRSNPFDKATGFNDFGPLRGI
jgi:type VI secretion system secreted protein VgrG